MSSFSVLVKLSQQMYEDIKFITENNPTQVIDEDTARIFNALLKEIRLSRPSNTILQFFSEMSPRTLKYKDALVVMGQLCKLMTILDSGSPDIDDLIRRSGSENPKPDMSKPDDEAEEKSAESEDEEKSELESIDESENQEFEPEITDEELYGTKSVKINDDGIVPFDLGDS